MNKTLPPAPKPGQPVTVSLDDLPAWLALHDLEIAGYDKAGRYYVQPKGVGDVHVQAG